MNFDEGDGATKLLFSQADAFSDTVNNPEGQENE